MTLILQVEKDDDDIIRLLVLDGINDSDLSIGIYLHCLSLLNQTRTIKNHSIANAENLGKKITKQLESTLASIKSPKDFLIYKDGETSKSNSPGFNSEKYLEIILRGQKSKMIFIDHPEDNLGTKFISTDLVSLIRDIKFNKQIFLITHNPSIVVYGDAESVIVASNKLGKISYEQIVLEDPASQKEICHILDGGQYIFDMRAKKYNIKRILLEETHE